MGIESDQLVFDYLSRVGDLAQQQHLSSGERMRLVAKLRTEIDRQRGGSAAETPAAVRKILGKLGDPSEIVAAAGEADGPQVPISEAAPAIPEQRRDDRRTLVDLEKDDEEDEDDPPRSWWRTDSDELPTGFHGGIIDPDLVGGRRRMPDLDEDEDEDDEDGEPRKQRPAVRKTARKTVRKTARKPVRPSLSLRKKPLAEEEEDEAEAEPAPAKKADTGFRIPANPLLLIAAALLVAGVFLGQLIPLAVGWVIVYASRRLTHGETQVALYGLPGLVAAIVGVWVWGRFDGRWGEPVAAGQDAMLAVFQEAWPWALRGAALASAAFLVWRSQRRV